MDRQYDYILGGGGTAGLTLALLMAKDSFFFDKRILIIDPQPKNTNDRTFCFWKNDIFPLEEIIYKKWDKLSFIDEKGQELDLELGDYTYNMIRGIDFYNHINPILKKAPHIDQVQAKIIQINEIGETVEVQTAQEKYFGRYFFKSYYDKINLSNYNSTIQHFKGYIIETEEGFFDPERSTLMDFSIPQEDDTRFFYVLPLSPTKALVEIAIFSNEIATNDEYDCWLKDYITNDLGIQKFTIEEEELGQIPMTDYPFKNHDTSQIIHIGTGGGNVKPSSGYAFMRIQKHIYKIVECLKFGDDPVNAKRIFSSKFKWYDRIFLNVILKNRVKGAAVFSAMFHRTPAKHIFEFLDEETTFLKDLNVIYTQKKWPFIKAVFDELF